MNTKIFILPRNLFKNPLRPLIILLGVLPLFMACAKVQVSQDYDTTYLFTAASTFNWNEALQQQNHERYHIDELLVARFTTAIDENLIQKGFRRSPYPDFLVSYIYEVSSRIEVDGLQSHFGFGYGHRYGRYGRFGGVGFDTGSIIQQYDQGKLVINIHSATTEKLIWKGIGTREVFTHSNPEQLTRRVNEMVSEILAQFPPFRP